METKTSDHVAKIRFFGVADALDVVGSRDQQGRVGSIALFLIGPVPSSDRGGVHSIMDSCGNEADRSIPSSRIANVLGMIFIRCNWLNVLDPNTFIDSYTAADRRWIAFESNGKVGSELRDANLDFRNAIARLLSSHLSAPAMN